MPLTECEECRKNPGIRLRKQVATCFVCKKKVTEVLDLHHTRADLCGLECEKRYWLDIFC